MKQNADGTWSEKHGKRGNDGNSITYDNGENPDNIS